MKEGHQISIKVAGQSFTLYNPRESTETLRAVERNFEQVWQKWRNDFQDQSQSEILAMVAFQYARYYYNLQQKVTDSEKAIIDFEQRLDEILLNVD